MPGSSAGGSLVIRRGDGIGVLGKNLFNYRYRERLETDSVVGKIVRKGGWITWFTWNTNHHLCRPQASFHSPEGEEALRPPWSDLRSPGRISRLGEYPHTRWEFSLKGKEWHGGISLSRNWPHFFIFSGLLIYFLLYIGMNTESRGGQQTWPLSKSGASYKCIQRSYGFYIIFWPWGLLTFYGPFW